ncbi:type I restriction endonuclease subunit R [Maribacter cobaltidurans]|uniref:type I site-specific deoxyribonuclease n=1 Tax=Maribacter cobaltidurans TaxID=1178778 RepID=A0A223V2U1_9FLAO|nr:type I restriction endonuclease [Maribacter cobaltidurans]ASV29724.1 restriction endonuclease subunit R [Maribacter cobaltidurans]GGD66409.1 type I restriction-modification system endonuclease [Maribacter cobaltidurans]
MMFNEDSRVKIPAILHLTQLGYTYLSLKESSWDVETNIFADIFKTSIERINPHLESQDIERLYQEISLSLDNNDLGKAFYNMLGQRSGTKLLDLENFGNNSFHVVTELTYKNGEDEFRPDVIVLINGMPLVFIEVKKPNNRDGVLDERRRIKRRFQNKKFKKFVNLTQFMIFSNNMEYDDNEIEPWQGAFYASPSYTNPIFNYFREEIGFNLSQVLKPLDPDTEDFVLRDTNYQAIKNSPEFLTNKKLDSPTNRMLTSLLSRERLEFMLRYALAYVNEYSGIQKHIMRYPQFFATMAIQEKLDKGIKKGIIWHTQGSGKTALAYYNTHFLTDYFQAKKIIPKFYFIVDRLDLLTQARDEFTARGLKVHTVNSKQEFLNDLKTTTAVYNAKGVREISVVNIQKFHDDKDLRINLDYDISIQRIYFLDEVHRSYDPKGSFLANLEQSDKNAIKIGLTGTPLIGRDLKSKDLFGDYIHKYYYNKSIADGYTLKLIREDIETEYQIKLKAALDSIDIKKGDTDRKLVYAHPSFVEPMLEYIVNDFEKFRVRNNDGSLGGMVICDSSEQARELFRIFNEKFGSVFNSLPKVAEEDTTYGNEWSANFKPKKAGLVLYDSGSKDELAERRDQFKSGKIDLLFVYNMLLTGFDAKRLKKLYLARVIKSHNLLQALTRVNRTYKDYRYGYVVDFADISLEFDKTNRAYFDELQEVLGDEMESYSNLFMSKEEIEVNISEIKETLADYELKNAEIFSSQISEIRDRGIMLKIKKALEDARSLYNVIRLTGEYDLLEKLDFRQLGRLRIMAIDHLALINAKQALEHNEEMGNLLNMALEDVVFLFKKVGEEELILADRLKDILRKTREGLASNFDTKDPEWISLYDELKRLFENKNLSEVTQEEMQRNMHSLKTIHEKVKELNRKNELLRAKYEGDQKYARVQKRLLEAGKPSKIRTAIIEALQNIKEQADMSILQRNNTLDNEAYFKREVARYVMKSFNQSLTTALDYDTVIFISDIIVNEYMNEYYNRPA